MTMLEEIARIAEACRIEAESRAVSEAELRSRLRDVLPGAIKKGEGLVMTVWDRDKRWELEASPFVPADQCYVLYPDRLAPAVPNAFRFDREPLLGMPPRPLIAKPIDGRIL